SHARHKEDTIDICDHVHPNEGLCKLKASNSHKGPYEFEKVEHVQELKLDQQEGPIWCMKFSSCGRLLATAGQDKILRVWVIRNAYTFFQDMRNKYNAKKVSPTPSTESLVSHQS
nr:putative WD repeat-containing protein 44 [Cucujiformia]